MSAGIGVGVVTIAHGRHAHLAAQHRSLAASARRPDHYVVVAMDDPDLVAHDVDGLRSEVVHVPTTPQGLPLSAARNAGVRTLVEHGVDVVVLLDVDCLAGRGLVASYAAAVTDEPRTVWSGPVTYLGPAPAGGYPLGGLDGLDAPHPARPAPPPGRRWPSDRPELFWSLSFAASASAWQAAGGFDEAYVGYGGEDTDFAQRVVSAGLGLAWDGGARAYHQHHAVSRPPVEHLDDILRNGRLYRDRWGTWPMTGWLEEMAALGLVRRIGDDWSRC